MVEKQYRALADGDWRSSPDGPAANVKAGDIVMLTDEQLASNPDNFELIDSGVSEAGAPRSTRRVRK